MLVFFIALLFPTVCLATEEKRAISSSFNAILAYPKAKEYRRTLNEKTIKKLDLNKTTVAVIGAGYTVFSGKTVSSKRFANMRAHALGGTVEPSLDMNVKSREASCKVFINWSFE